MKTDIQLVRYGNLLIYKCQFLTDCIIFHLIKFYGLNVFHFLMAWAPLLFETWF